MHLTLASHKEEEYLQYSMTSPMELCEHCVQTANDRLWAELGDGNH